MNTFKKGMAYQMKIGIDLGGSHIGIGLVDKDGKIVRKVEKFFNDKIDIKSDIENFILEQVANLMNQENIESIGIAVPGTVSKNKIARAVNLGIENYDLAYNLEKHFNINVKLKNDAKCAALAEQKYGQISKYQNSIFLCIGTGVGGAVIHQGTLLEARDVPGFEFSHTIIQKNGELCNCGKRGCFEVYASLKRFKENFSREFNLNTMYGDAIRTYIKENVNNLKVESIIDTYIDNLSIGISNFINIFEPDAICIGGSFAEYEEIFFNRLKTKIIDGNLLFNKRDDIILEHALLKNDAGIIGATFI